MLDFDKPIANFRNLIDAVRIEAVSKEILLPITHIPKWIRLSNIIKDKHLKPFPGSKYYENEELVFFTYGRNVFLPKAVRNQQTEAFPPFALIFDLAEMAKPKRLLPFDSGGFEFYEMEEGLGPRDFEIPFIDPIDIKKLVYILFRNHRKYLRYEHKFDELIQSLPGLRHIKELHVLYEKQALQTTGIGKQGKSFELHFDSQVPLKPFLIIAPHIYYTKQAGRDQLNLMFPGVDILPYQAVGNPHVHLHNINEVLEKYITRRKNRKCA